MKIMSLLLICFSAFYYSQNKSGESAREKQSSPLFKLTPPAVNVIKPKVDSIEYKMLVKKVDKPELYVMMVKKPEAVMIEIPNLQSLPKKNWNYLKKRLPINKMVLPFAEGDEQRMMLSGLRRFTKYTNQPNVIALTEKVAEHFVEKGSY